MGSISKLLLKTALFGLVASTITACGGGGESTDIGTNSTTVNTFNESVELGGDKIVNVLSEVTLDATYSSNNNSINDSKLRWAQTSGPTVNITHPGGLLGTARFLIPYSDNQEILTFEVSIVKNNGNVVNKDSVRVIANPHAQLKWAVITDGALMSSVSQSVDGTIIFGSDDNGNLNTLKGTLYAINPDGTEKWTKNFGRVIFNQPTISHNGNIYVSVIDRYTSGNNLFASITTDGELEWQYDFNNIRTTTPAVAPDGTIYVGTHDDIFHALNPDGTIHWQYNLNPEGWQNHAYFVEAITVNEDGSLYVGTRYGCLCLFNQDGTIKWRFYPSEEQSNYTGFTYRPTIAADGTIYIGSEGYTLYAVNPDGSLKWFYTTDNKVSTKVALGPDGTIYFGNYHRFYALNPDGTLKWQFDSIKYNTSSFLAVTVSDDGTVYTGGTDGNLYALDSNGTLKWNYTTRGWVTSAQFAEDGTLLVGSEDGTLYAFDTSVIP
jgi:outer membrane protein assembly factor BamB